MTAVSSKHYSRRHTAAQEADDQGTPKKIWREKCGLILGLAGERWNGMHTAIVDEDKRLCSTGKYMQ